MMLKGERCEGLLASLDAENPRASGEILCKDESEPCGRGVLRRTDSLSLGRGAWRYHELSPGGQTRHRLVKPC